mmetsp:Transcript_38556/g.68991  ORF Transcript_38556/g.68991 Transcript_38556/m.68991 type:complete len:565 (+) Transcript_38556:2-1696(+)
MGSRSFDRPAPTLAVMGQGDVCPEEMCEAVPSEFDLSQLLRRNAEALSELKWQQVALFRTVANVEDQCRLALERLSTDRSASSSTSSPSEEIPISSAVPYHAQVHGTEGATTAAAGSGMGAALERQSTMQMTDDLGGVKRRTLGGMRLLEQLREGDGLQKTATMPLPPWSEGLWQVCRIFCQRLVAKAWFRVLVSVIIVANAVVIGMQTEMRQSSEVQEVASMLEKCFLALYTLEIGVKLVAHKLQNFRDGWFVFDFVLVCFSYFEQMLLLFMPGELDAQLMVWRLLRLIRAARSFRMIKQFRPLLRLVSGLLNSVGTVLTTFALLALVIFVFAIVAAEIIIDDEDLHQDPTTNRIVQERFSSLLTTITTLTQFVTLDGVTEIYIPLAKARWALSFYFIILVALVSICLMNLVTAVLVEGAFEHAKQEREEEAKLEKIRATKMIPRILDLFNMIDADASGYITLDEMMAFDFQGQIPAQVMDRASVGSMKELFMILDVDGSGRVTKEEFQSGLLNVLMHEVPPSSLQMLKMLRRLRGSVEQLKSDFQLLVGPQQPGLGFTTWAF